MDASFSLGDLLRVGLHQAVDACSEIIDRAQKELIIEKALKKIEDTWGALTLSFTPYQARTICFPHMTDMPYEIAAQCFGLAAFASQQHH